MKIKSSSYNDKLIIIENNLLGIGDINENILIYPKYNKLECYHENLIIADNKIIDINDNILFEFDYDYNFSNYSEINNQLILYNNNFICIYDIENNFNVIYTYEISIESIIDIYVYISNKYYEISFEYNDYVNYIVIDNKGNIIRDNIDRIKSEDYYIESNNPTKNYQYLKYYNINKTILCDENYKTIFIADNIRRINDSIFLYEINQKYGFIKNKTLLTPPIYENPIYDFDDGYFVIIENNIININNEIINHDFDYIGHKMYNYYIMVKLKNHEQWSLFNIKNNKFIIHDLEKNDIKFYNKFIYVDYKILNYDGEILFYLNKNEKLECINDIIRIYDENSYIIKLIFIDDCSKLKIIEVNYQNYYHLSYNKNIVILYNEKCSFDIYKNGELIFNNCQKLSENHEYNKFLIFNKDNYYYIKNQYDEFLKIDQDELVGVKPKIIKDDKFNNYYYVFNNIITDEKLNILYKTESIISDIRRFHEYKDNELPDLLLIENKNFYAILDSNFNHLTDFIYDGFRNYCLDTDNNLHILIMEIEDGKFYFKYLNNNLIPIWQGI